MATTDLAGLGLDEGGHLLVGRGLARLAPGDRLTVTGRHPALRLHLGAWCREHGHRLWSQVKIDRIAYIVGIPILT